MEALKYKKPLFLFVIILILGIMTNTCVAAANASTKQILVTMNGKAVKLGTPVTVIKSEFFVSYSDLNKVINVKCVYNSTKKTVSISSKGMEIVLRAGLKYAYVNGKKVGVGVPLSLSGKKVLIPLGFVLKQYGYKYQLSKDGSLLSITGAGKPEKDTSSKGNSLPAKPDIYAPAGDTSDESTSAGDSSTGSTPSESNTEASTPDQSTPDQSTGESNVSTGTDKKEINSDDYEIKFRKETEHFAFYCTLDEAESLGTLPEDLEKSYKRVTSDLGHMLDFKLYIYIYPGLDDFHKAIRMPQAPTWLIGDSSERGVIRIVSTKSIYMTNPLNVLTHELTHAVTSNMSIGTPQWLFQGVAIYEGEKASPAQNCAAVSQALIDNSIPSIDSLPKDYWGFADANGYEFSYAFVEFLVEKYGFEKIRRLFATPNDLKGVYGMSEDELHSQWVNYLRAKYNYY